MTDESTEVNFLREKAAKLQEENDQLRMMNQQLSVLSQELLAKLKASDPGVVSTHEDDPAPQG